MRHTVSSFDLLLRWFRCGVALPRLVSVALVFSELGAYRLADSACFQSMYLQGFVLHLGYKQQRVTVGHTFYCQTSDAVRAEQCGRFEHVASGCDAGFNRHVCTASRKDLKCQPDGTKKFPNPPGCRLQPRLRPRWREAVTNKNLKLFGSARLAFAVL